MNRLEFLIVSLEKEMKDKGIKKGDLYGIVTKETVASLFNKYKGTLATLSKIIDYVDNVK